MRNRVISGFLIAGSLIACNAMAGSVTNPIGVQATVVPGCVLGIASTGAFTNYGTIDFGSVTNLTSNVDVTTSNGAGSIVLTCTPGIPASIALDAGLNSSSTSARLLKSGTDTLGYQLYQNSARTILWGTGSDAYNFTTLPVPSQTTIYARLNSQTNFPAAGTYTDTVTATISW